jgi:hypothetical protein
LNNLVFLRAFKFVILQGLQVNSSFQRVYLANGKAPARNRGFSYSELSIADELKLMRHREKVFFAGAKPLFSSCLWMKEKIACG